jgi:hypothetical protein
MSLQSVLLVLSAASIVACAPTAIADPPADHPASAHANARELPVLTKIEAPAIPASHPSSQPASQPSSQPSSQPMDHSKHKMPEEKTPEKKADKKPEKPKPKKTEPDHSGHDAHQRHEGGHQ